MAFRSGETNPQAGANIMKVLPGALLERCACLHGALAAAIAIALHFPGTLSSARAEVTVQGGIDAVRVEAQESSIAEVLAALDTSFSLQYRKSHELNRPDSGTHKGPLWLVV